MTKKYLKHFSLCECVSYPHALHSRHGPEGPQGPQGSHCPEGLDPTSAKQGGSEVDEGDLGLLVGFNVISMLLVVFQLAYIVSVMVLVRHVGVGQGGELIVNLGRLVREGLDRGPDTIY